MKKWSANVKDYEKRFRHILIINPTFYHLYLTANFKERLAKLVEVHLPQNLLFCLEILQFQETSLILFLELFSHPLLRIGLCHHLILVQGLLLFLQSGLHPQLSQELQDSLLVVQAQPSRNTIQFYMIFGL